MMKLKIEEFQFIISSQHNHASHTGHALLLYLLKSLRTPLVSSSLHTEYSYPGLEK